MTDVVKPRKVEAIECPGWTASDGKHHACSPQRDRYGHSGSTNIIRADQKMCDRCARQLRKYETDVVNRNTAAEDDLKRRRGRGAAWLGDLPESVRDWAREYRQTLQQMVTALEGLPSRSHYSWGPEEQFAVTTSSSYYDKPNHGDRWDVLRLLADLDLEPGNWRQ